MPSQVGSGSFNGADDILVEISSLKKIMSAKTVPRRPRFPFPCRNGHLCPFLACAGCWFVHEGDDVPVMGKDTKTFTSEGKKASQFGKAEHKSQLEALIEKRVAEVQSEVDKKFASFSQHLDRHLASIESKLEALAEASYSFEEKMDDKFNRSMEEVAVCFENQSDEKLEQGLDGMRTLIAATVEMLSTKMGNRFAKVDEQIDEKLQEFLKSSVKDALEAAMSSFGDHVGARIQTIEEKCLLLYDGNGEKT